MKQILKVMMFGTLTAFLLGVALAAIFWLYVNPQRLPSQLSSAMVLPQQNIDMVDQAAPSNISLDRLAILEAEAQARSLVYEEQIETLQATIRDRESVYQAQLTEVNDQIAAYQTTIDQIQQEIAVLTTEASAVEQLAVDRQNAYQGQLNDLAQQTNAYRAELVTQLSTIRAALAEANASLAR